jgi:dipeptidyl aminopeptidase/acylaminoacyl peptidase
VSTKPPIGVFGISPDGQTAVFAPLVPKGYGGPLYLLTISTAQAIRLTRGPYFNTWPNEGGPDVYSDPDFSPDGKRVLFAIHGQATGDVVEASGPLAVMDLRTRKTTLVRSTLTASAGQVAFANSPHWSPDGNRILVNFENGFAITEATGRTLKDLDEMIPESEGELRFALGWVGRGCVLYMAGNSWDKARQGPKRILNLTTGKTAPADPLIPPLLETGLMAFSPRLVVRYDAQGRMIVEGTRRQITPWEIPGDEKTTSVRVLASPEDAELIPESCR